MRDGAARRTCSRGTRRCRECRAPRRRPSPCACAASARRARAPPRAPAGRRRRTARRGTTAATCRGRRSCSGRTPTPIRKCRTALRRRQGLVHAPVDFTRPKPAPHALLSQGAMSVTVSHARDADWDAGLRQFFAYRDLGVAGATQGRVGPHGIRARGASDAPGERHRHALDFQMVYVLRGWIDFDYEGAGRVRLETRSCGVPPPGMRHDELAHSADLEMLEITLPAEFPTSTD